MREGTSIDSKYYAAWNRELKDWEYLEDGDLMPDVTETLYKYLPWNDNTIAALLGRYLWLSNPVDFNDPFDCNRSMIFNYQFTEDEKNIKRNKFDHVGITSFTENKFCPLMWAHYTGNYNGIVLKFAGKYFKRLENKSQFENIKLRKVIYPEKFIPFAAGFSFSNDLLKFIKTKSWSYEREWRLIAELKDPENRFLKFDYKALEEIYIGHNLFEKQGKAIQVLTQIADTFYPSTKLTRIFPDSEVFGQIVFRSWDKEINRIVKKNE